MLTQLPGSCTHGSGFPSIQLREKILIISPHFTPTVALIFHSVNIYNNELVQISKEFSNCLMNHAKVTLSYIQCVKGFYRTSVIIKQKNLVIDLVLSYQHHLTCKTKSQSNH